jgi:inner membrane protein involved in colicin E2 resistance
MTRRIVAIIFIFGCTAVGWMILGDVTTTRTWEQDQKLGSEVGQLWGTVQQQRAPLVRYATYENQEVTRYVGETAYKEVQKVPIWHTIALTSSDVDVDFKLSHRKKGLLWYSTYKVDFQAHYKIENKTDQRRELHFDFSLPAQGAVYDDFKFAVDQKEVEDVKMTSGTVTFRCELDPKEGRQLFISYRTQGLDEWRYDFGNVAQVRNFALNMQTDFEEVDFPRASMSPTEKERTPNGWLLGWKYSNLLSGVQIGMVMPKKLNPGPWVSKITFFAPISLLFFFFLLFIFTTVENIRVHPMNYFFLGAAFFSFHLLLAYLADIVSIHLGFMISSLVSILPVVSYMRLVVGGRFAILHVGISQFVYLVGFSYTFFFEGATGLAVTIMCIVTLFIVMQYTGKLDWEKVFKEASGRLEQAVINANSS